MFFPLLVQQSEISTIQLNDRRILIQLQIKEGSTHSRTSGMESSYYFSFTKRKGHPLILQSL